MGTELSPSAGIPRHGLQDATSALSGSPSPTPPSVGSEVQSPLKPSEEKYLSLESLLDKIDQMERTAGSTRPTNELGGLFKEAQRHQKLVDRSGASLGTKSPQRLWTGGVAGRVRQGGGGWTTQGRADPGRELRDDRGQRDRALRDLQAALATRQREAQRIEHQLWMKELDDRYKVTKQPISKETQDHLRLVTSAETTLKDLRRTLETEESRGAACSIM